jgi:hypothetical protein
MEVKSSASLISIVTLLLLSMGGSSAFNFPRQISLSHCRLSCSRQVVSSPRNTFDTPLFFHRNAGFKQGRNKSMDCKHAYNNNIHYIHSIAVVVACRRLLFLVLSISLVNFVRFTILKVRMHERYYIRTNPIQSYLSVHLTLFCRQDSKE